MKKFIQPIVCLLTGLIFINAGLSKFFHYIPVPDGLPEQLERMNAAMVEIGWLLHLVAIAEIAGGILFISSRTFRPTISSSSLPCPVMGHV